MTNKSYFLFQFKKWLWLSCMIALAAITFAFNTLNPMSLLGVGLGIGVFHCLPLLPTRVSGLLILASPILALLTPFTMAFNLSFLGIMAHRIMEPSNLKEVFKNTHTLGEKTDENEDLELFNKLESKTNININEIKVCDVDAQKFAPNAAAAGGFYKHTIYVWSNFMQAPFTRKEKKAVYAHELGHIKHWDFLSGTTTSALWYFTTIASLASFSLPVSIGLCFMTSLSYYSVSQMNELLADWHASKHSNPKSLISALDKLLEAKKNLPKPEEVSLWETVQKPLNFVKRQTGMISHPPTSLRNAYLEEYAREKARLTT